MKTIAVIPARYASTRMPGKPLADVLGKPMIYWVYKAARACPKLDDVLIATDDERIADACKTYDMRYIMTSPDLQSHSTSNSATRNASPPLTCN
jgi:3-deoxy-manno-octulosonate cytidylyltransferase (CMP-KDO synthetase)